MIKFSFNLFNPIVRTRTVHMLWWAGGSFTTNKHWEIELSCDELNTIVGVEIDTNFIGSDHAGVNITMILFGIKLFVSMYDSRHWDYKNNKWEEYNDTQNSSINYD